MTIAEHFNDAFLGVDQSASGQRWVDALDWKQKGQAEAIEERWGLSGIVSRVLAARDVMPEEAEAFLSPTLRELLVDPSRLTDLDQSCARLATAIEQKEQVAIFGDYDVDGAASAALLGRFFQHHGVPFEIYIPDRIFEGYGPNELAISELKDRGASLLITVDCGSTSHSSLAHAQKLGLDCVVIDHHQVDAELPPAAALVNPNRHDDLSGQGHLCAAGVVFLVLVGLNRHLRASASIAGLPFDLMAVLDLVALATVCDIVPLKGVNRAFVLRGLETLEKSRHPGLRTLIRAARLDGPVRPWHFGFILGPRINAGGRIGDAALGARLLMTMDAGEAEAIAGQLDSLNRERQVMEIRMLEEAVSEAEREIGDGPGPAVLVTQSDTWHAGIVGLLASRLKDRFHRPAFAITFDDRNVGTGSGRSISGVDLGAAVRSAVENEILVKGGGHAMAAGLTVRRDKLGAFRAHVEETCQRSVEANASRRLKIDAAVSASAANLGLLRDLARCGPFGAGHRAPVFAFPSHRLMNASVVGGNHIRVVLQAQSGATVEGISFRSVDTPLGDFLLNARGEKIHVVGTLETNFYRGSERVQLRVMDVAHSAPT
ncbi:MAG: single-stranded-DNA-specific exonuclease RecJ [Pseudomonadota bacterium]